MATKQVTFKGKALWFKPWELDTEFADDMRGGNSAVNIILDADGIAAFKELKVKAKLHPENGKDGGDLNRIVLRRYERHPVLGELGPVVITGVGENISVGNGSDITVVADMYDYEYRGKSSRGLRLVSVNVDTLIPYEKPDTQSKPAIGVPVV